MSIGVIVTGAGDSVGRVIAEKFLDADAKVHICDVNAEALEATLKANPALTGTQANIANVADVKQLFSDAVKQLPNISVLVNCVGIGGPRGLTEEISMEAWKQTFDVNVHGVFSVMQHAIPIMKAQKFGSIVNFSTSSTRTRLPSRTAYVASKFALEGLTLNAARELGAYGIRCNAVQPGIIDNPRMQSIIETRAKEEGKSVDQINLEYVKYISMRCKVSMQDVANTVFYLASDAAARVTGELISVSGGLEWEA